jgi:P27 family predicted phage terminase small subunit
MPGPPKIPTNLKMWRGTYRPDRSNLREPQPAIEIPSCPKVVRQDKEAWKEWRRMSRELRQLGLVTALDRAALSAYCLLWSRWIDAEAKVREKGSVVRGSEGPVMNPYLRVASRTLDGLKAILLEFDMTPSSRSRVSANPVAGDDDDDRFFKPPA